MYSTKEIYDLYLENKQERIKASFDMPASRAVEDTAIMFDISIKEVCQAISIHEDEGRLYEE